MGTKYIVYYSLIFFIFFTNFVFAQIDTQEKLEQKRKALQQEILQINKRLSQTRKTEKGVLSEYNQIKRKINVRRQLIKNLQKEINTSVMQ